MADAPVPAQAFFDRNFGIRNRDLEKIIDAAMGKKADYADLKSPNVGVEFCGTSITSRSGSGGNAGTAERMAENPHYIYAEADRKGYGIAEFSPERLSVSLRVVDDVASRDTKIETLASFAVQAGQPLIERA